MSGARFWSTRRRLAGPLLGLLALAGCNTENPGGQNPASFDPPEIALLRVEPADGESSVPRNRAVTMIFSTTVLPQSVHDQSIQVRTGAQFQTRPLGSFIVSGNVVEFNPTVIQGGGENALGFPAGQQIRVKVPLFSPTAGQSSTSFFQANNFVQNIEGNPITVATGDSEIIFTTGAGWIDPIPGPPGVVDVRFIPPPNSLGQVPADAAVTVVFNEPIDPSTVVLGKNIFLTNNSPTAPPTIYLKDIPSQTFFSLSMREITFKPIFGFGTGPFNIKVNFIDPDAPQTFSPNNLPTDLVGNQIQNFTFLATFDTQFDPTVKNTGLIVEDFTSTAKRDNSPGATTCLWGDDQQFPFALVGQPVTTRLATVNVQNLMNNGASTAIPPRPPTGGVEARYCPTANPLVSPDVPIPPGNPPTSAGRRQLNLYRVGELGPSGTITRAAWGPDSDALFASSYPGVIVRLGHKKPGTSLTEGSLFGNFNVDGWVTVANVANYTVPQAKDVNNDNTINNGFFDWPKFDTFFNYDGANDVIIDVEAKEGTNWQGFRTFLSVTDIGGCSCTTFFGCGINSAFGMRQMDSTFGGDNDDPPNLSQFGSVLNPGPWVHVMRFEVKRLVTQGTSRYYDTGVANPTFLSPIISPVIQPGGASAEIFWSGSADGTVDLTGWQSNIAAINGHRYIRFRVICTSNLFTLARPRIDRIDIAFTFP